MTEPIAATVYASQLSQLQLGYPLWDPDPQDQPPVEIADVGYIKYGTFIHLFNASKKPSDVFNILGTPDGYEPLQVGSIRTRSALPANVPLQSDSVRQVGVQATISGGSYVGTGFSFECSKERGAVLLLGDDADRRDALHIKAFARYICKHQASWLTFANEIHERDIALNDLLLVTGCDKTSSWACASFSAKSSEARLSVTVGQLGIVQGGISMTWGWKNGSAVATHSGPRRPTSIFSHPTTSRDSGDDRTSDEDGDVIMTETVNNMVTPPPRALLRDQCVFVRGYKMCDKRTAKARILARASKHVYDGFDYVERKSGDKKSPRSSGSSGSSGQASPPGPSGSTGSPLERGGTSENDRSAQLEFKDRLRERSGSPSGSDTIDSQSSCLDSGSDEDSLHLPSKFCKEPTLLDITLEYILENSAAQLALVHDDDLIVLLQDTDSPSSYFSYVLQNKKSVDSYCYYEDWISKIAPRIFVTGQVGMLETTYRQSLSDTQDIPVQTYTLATSPENLNLTVPKVYKFSYVPDQLENPQIENQQGISDSPPGPSSVDCDDGEDAIADSASGEHTAPLTIQPESSAFFPSGFAYPPSMPNDSSNLPPTSIDSMDAFAKLRESGKAIATHSPVRIPGVRSDAEVDSLIKSVANTGRYVCLDWPYCPYGMVDPSDRANARDHIHKDHLKEAKVYGCDTCDAQFLRLCDAQYHHRGDSSVWLQTLMREYNKRHRRCREQRFEVQSGSPSDGTTVEKVDSLDLINEHREAPSGYTTNTRMNHEVPVGQRSTHDPHDLSPFRSPRSKFTRDEQTVELSAHAHPRVKFSERPPRAAIKSSSRRYVCDECGERFDRPSSLETHLRTHNGMKPFVCGHPGCGKTFSVKSNMVRHERRHGADGAFEAVEEYDHGAQEGDRSGSLILPLPNASRSYYARRTTTTGTGGSYYTSSRRSDTSNLLSLLNNTTLPPNKAIE